MLAELELPKGRAISVRRVLTVTGGLVVTGAVAGGIAGGLAAVIAIALAERTWSTFTEPFYFVMGAEFGAPLGAIILPIAGWALMRHVPLGRAIVGTIAGALVGGLLGWFLPIGVFEPFRAMAGGLVGFTAAVLLLRWKARTRR